MITKEFTNKELAAHVSWMHRMLMSLTAGLMSDDEVELSWAVINRLNGAEESFK